MLCLRGRSRQTTRPHDVWNIATITLATVRPMAMKLRLLLWARVVFSLDLRTRYRKTT